MIDQRRSRDRRDRAAADAGVRLVPYLDVDEAVCTDDEIAESVETNAGQSHEHTRVVQVVLLEVARGRVVFDECVTIPKAIITTSEFGSADLLDAMQTNIFPCTFRAGWPHAVVTSTSGRARLIASTTANVCSRLSPSASRADEMGLLGMSFSGVYSELEPTLRRPAARRVHEDYSTKVALWRAIGTTCRPHFGVFGY
jgi:hypothetical protein